MGNMILKDKIKMMHRARPTVADKYNVAGGVLEGLSSLKFGSLVSYGDAAGYYKDAAGVSSVSEIAGVILATNVKVAGTYPDDGREGEVKPNEGFDLFLDGYIALPLASTAKEADIKAGKNVAVKLADATLTTVPAESVVGTVVLPGWTFTGMFEKEGSTIVAEIKITR